MNRLRSFVPAVAMALAASALFAQELPLKGLSLNPATLPGGHRVQGTIELSRPPDAGGISVALTSGDPYLAVVPPSVTIVNGTSATFVVETQPISEDQIITIKARAGTQTIETELRLRKPAVQHASLDAPPICDGDREGTLKYLLTGPAPLGMKVVARASVQSAALGNSADSSAPVPVGHSEGSFRVRLPKCQKGPGERCTIFGWARMDSPAMVVTFTGSCGHSPY